MVRTLLAISVLAIHISVTLAEDGNRKSGQAADNAETPLQQAYSKQRDLFAKYRAAEQEALKGTDLDKFRSSMNDAVALLNKKIESLTVDEREAEQAAREKLDAAIDKKIESSAEVATLQQKMKLLETQRRDLNFEIALISVRLRHGDSPLQQELDKDADLQKLRAATNTGTREERNAAFKKYQEAREAKLQTLKDAKPLLAKVEDLKTQITEGEKSRYETWNEINRTKQKIRVAEDKSLQPLRDKLASAREATRKAGFHEDTKELRDAVNTASQAFRKRHTELTSGNEELVDLREQIDAINREIRQLQPKKQPSPDRSKAKGQKSK